MKRFVTGVLVVFALFIVASKLPAADTAVNWGEEYIKARGLGSFRGEPTSRKLIIAREKAKMRAQRDLIGIIDKLNIDSETTMKETMENDEFSEIIHRQIKGVLRGAKILTEGQLNRNTYEVIMGVKFADVRKAVLVKKDPSRKADPKDNPIIIPSRNFLSLGNPGVSEIDYMKPASGTVPAETATARPAAVSSVRTMVTGNEPATAAGREERQAGGDSTTAPAKRELTEDELDAALVGALPGQSKDGGAAAEAPAESATWNPPAGHSDVDEASSTYTSLIVDGRGLGADRAFWPRVLGPDHEVVYGNYDASVDFLQDEGAVAYVSTLAEARKCNRAMARPLIVKAVDVFGKYKADLVLSAKDVAKVREADAESGFLKAYRVIFVLD